MQISPKPALIGRLVDPTARDLFLDWFIFLLQNEYGVRGHSAGGETNTIHLRDERECTAYWSEADGDILVDAPEDILERVVCLAQSSHRSALAGDTGQPVWWRRSFGVEGTSEASFLHMIRNAVQHKPRNGEYQLGNEIFINIRQTNTSMFPQLFPGCAVEVIFRSMGPDHGPFSRNKADRHLAFVRSTISFIMSAALKGVGAIWPVTEDEKLADATQRLERPRGRYLWADGFPLWEMIPILAAHENSEGVDRIFGALLAYEQGSFTEDL